MSLNTEMISKPFGAVYKPLRANLKESLPVPAIRAMAKARYAYLQLRMPMTFGAAVALTDPEIENLVLVRNTYADTKMWTLPGGRITETKKAREITKSGVANLPLELFEPSARKELDEEIGVDPTNLVFNHLMKYVCRPHGNLDRAEIFHAATDLNGIEFIPQKSEIAAVEIHSINRLPEHSAPYMGELAVKLQTLREDTQNF